MMFGLDAGQQFTITLRPTEFITQAVVGFANMTCKNETVSGLCSLQFAVNEGAVPDFNANANCSRQAYTRISLGSSLAYLGSSSNGWGINYITGLHFSYYDMNSV